MLLVILAAGCSSDDSTPVATPMETSVIRAYRAGDTLKASMTLTRLADNQTATGELTVTIGDIVQNPYGVDCRVAIYSGTLTGPAGTVSLVHRELAYQDGDNSMYACGEFNETLGRYVFLDDTAVSPNGIFLEDKSPMQIGNTTSGVITYDDGTWEDCTKTVQAIENVSIPLGFYESYKVHEACAYSDGTTSDEIIWIAPGIFELKSLGTMDGFSNEYVLTDYSFN